MSSPNFTEFERIVIRSKNQFGEAVLLVLAWIAASDGDIDDKELQELSAVAAASNHSHDINLLLRTVRNRDLKAIQLACEIIAASIRHDREKSILFLAWAIGMAISDGYLLPSENHVLQFLSDLLGVSSIGLNAVFQEVTGRTIPEPSDVSSAHHWRDRESGEKRSGQQPSSKMVKMYSILGLEPSANKEEIRTAYRRMAHTQHPDRFVPLGKEAVAAAEAKFKKINEAYKYLMRHA